MLLLCHLVLFVLICSHRNPYFQIALAVPGKSLDPEFAAAVRAFHRTQVNELKGKARIDSRHSEIVYLRPLIDRRKGQQVLNATDRFAAIQTFSTPSLFQPPETCACMKALRRTFGLS